MEEIILYLVDIYNKTKDNLDDEEGPFGANYAGPPKKK